MPPPWSAGRRLVAAAIAGAVVLGAGGLWWIGALGPNVGPVWGYGLGARDGTAETAADGDRSGVVDVELQLTNRGWFAVRDLTVDGPPIDGGSLEQPGGPVDLPPRSETTVPLRLAVDDCSRFETWISPGLSDTARGGLLPVRDRPLRLPGGEHATVTPTWRGVDDPAFAGWWYEVAQPVCDPEGFLEP